MRRRRPSNREWKMLYQTLDEWKAIDHQIAMARQMLAVEAIVYSTVPPRYSQNRLERILAERPSHVPVPSELWDFRDEVAQVIEQSRTRSRLNPTPAEEVRIYTEMLQTIGWYVRRMPLASRELADTALTALMTMQSRVMELAKLDPAVHTEFQAVLGALGTWRDNFERERAR